LGARERGVGVGMGMVVVEKVHTPKERKGKQRKECYGYGLWSVDELEECFEPFLSNFLKCLIEVQKL